MRPASRVPRRMIAFGSSRPSARTTSPALLVLFGALFAVLLVRTAWLSDQAYLTLRSVHHLSLGHGLRFNVAERVLVFDHPLWALLLATAHQVTGELYWTPLVLGILASALTVAMLLRQAPSDEHLVLCGIFLCLSPAFVTYSTSGLANPLVHLGLVVFLTIALKQPSSTPFGLSGYTIAGLTVLADPMTMLLMLPILGRDTAVRGLRRSLPLWALGLAPAVAWVAWASWYYGTPVRTR